MVEGFLKHVNAVINQSDLVLEILDARYPEKTTNYELEKQVLIRRKRIIYVINKSDLVDKEELQRKKKQISGSTNGKVIFVSALKKDGINLIRREIAAMKGKEGKITVGIIGYPNVGKSTLINSLAGKGRGRVATSRKAGLTRGIQTIRLGNGVYLLDSPGIIPPRENEFNLFLVESKNPNQLNDVEKVALQLIQEFGKEKIADYFEIEDYEKLDEEELLDAIAVKKNLYKRGKKPDQGKAARYLLEKYQRHELV